MKAYYITTSSVRLFSPQSYFMLEYGCLFMLNSKGCIFTFFSGKILTFEYSSGSVLLIANAVPKTELIPRSFYNTTNWAGESTGKLDTSKAQEELLL